MPSTSRRSFLQSSAAAGAAMLAPSVWAQSPWPSKPIRIVVPDIAAYDAVYRKLTSQIEIFGVNSSFAMEEIKHTTALPLEYIKPGA